MVLEKTTHPRACDVKKSRLPHYEEMAENVWEALCDSFPTLGDINPTTAKVVIKAACIRGGNTKKDGAGVPPEVDQVRAYCAEIGAQFDPEAFCDYYSLRDWCVSVGKVAQRMTDWRAAARLWKREGWGINKARPQIIEKFSEWEISKKRERIMVLKTQIREMRYPGGCAYAVSLEGDKLLKAQVIQAEIETIEKELRASQ